MPEDLFDEELDEAIDEEASETPILDATEEEIRNKKSRSKNTVGIFPEDEEKEKKANRKKKNKKERTPRVLAPVPQELLDEIGDALSSFDAEVAVKREIRSLRALLQKLSLARYPKKKKERKEKLVIKKKK